MCCRTVFCLLAHDSALVGPPGGRLALAGRLPTGKARLARRLQALNGGADVCKSLVKGPVLPAGTSAAGASGPQERVATNGTATALTDSAGLF